jgi:hypothetical protein
MEGYHDEQERQVKGGIKKLDAKAAANGSGKGGKGAPKAGKGAKAAAKPSASAGVRPRPTSRRTLRRLGARLRAPATRASLAAADKAEGAEGDSYFKARAAGQRLNPRAKATGGKTVRLVVKGHRKIPVNSCRIGL